jgi:hypothetical protein
LGDLFQLFHESVSIDAPTPSQFLHALIPLVLPVDVEFIEQRRRLGVLLEDRIGAHAA